MGQSADAKLFFGIIIVDDGGGTMFDSFPIEEHLAFVAGFSEPLVGFPDVEYAPRKPGSPRQYTPESEARLDVYRAARDARKERRDAAIKEKFGDVKLETGKSGGDDFGAHYVYVDGLETRADWGDIAEVPALGGATPEALAALNAIREAVAEDEEGDPIDWSEPGWFLAVSFG